MKHFVGIAQHEGLVVLVREDGVAESKHLTPFSDLGYEVGCSGEKAIFLGVAMAIELHPDQAFTRQDGLLIAESILSSLPVDREWTVTETEIDLVLSTQDKIEECASRRWRRGHMLLELTAPVAPEGHVLEVRTPTDKNGRTRIEVWAMKQETVST